MLLKLFAVAALVLAGSTAAVPASTNAGARAAAPGQYIVMLKDSGSSKPLPVAKVAEVLSARYRGVVGSVWEGLRGFTVALSDADARRLSGESTVDHVTRDSFHLAPRPQRERGAIGQVTPTGAQTPVTWGLDRIDQHARPLDNAYAYDDSAGTGVRAYVISSGITLSHPDFGGRAGYGPNFSGDGGISNDCLSTGTEIAGTIAGTNYGVAKNANVIGVRIYTGTTSQCTGVINAPFSGILSAFNWVIANAVRPAVIVYNVGDGCVDTTTGQPIAGRQRRGDLDRCGFG